MTGGQTTAQRVAITRCAALTIAAERTRENFLRGVASAVDLDMVERALVRAEKNLLKLACLPAPSEKSAKKSSMSWEEATARMKAVASAPPANVRRGAGAVNRF